MQRRSLACLFPQPAASPAASHFFLSSPSLPCAADRLSRGGDGGGGAAPTPSDQSRSPCVGLPHVPGTGSPQVTVQARAQYPVRSDTPRWTLPSSPLPSTQVCHRHSTESCWTVTCSSQGIWQPHPQKYESTAPRLRVILPRDLLSN